MRLFIAVDFNSKEYFSQIQSEINKICPIGVNYVSSYHCTLKFLGEVKEEMADRIKAKLREVKFEAFNSTCTNIGFFPSLKEITKTAITPNLNVGAFNREVFGIENCRTKVPCIKPRQFSIRVIWIGLQPNDKITELKCKIDNTLEGVGITKEQKDKDFVPHITLARIRNANDVNALHKSIQKINLKHEDFAVKSFKLIKSTLTRSGPIYETIEEYLAKQI